MSEPIESRDPFPISPLGGSRGVRPSDPPTHRPTDADPCPLLLSSTPSLLGSSCTNVLLYNRGSARDYDAWKVPGWGSQDVLDYFKRSEKNSDFQVSGDTKHHGKDGPLSVSAVRYTTPLINTFLQASYKAGYAKNDDFNNWDRDQDGVGPFHVAQKDGERSSAASAYLSSVEAEASLSVVTGAQVQKLDICPEKREALSGRP